MVPGLAVLSGTVLVLKCVVAGCWNVFTVITTADSFEDKTVLSLTISLFSAKSDIRPTTARVPGRSIITFLLMSPSVMESRKNQADLIPRFFFFFFCPAVTL